MVGGATSANLKITGATTIHKMTNLMSNFWHRAHCLKITTQNVAFEFVNFGIFHQFLSYKN